ncbi:UDP-N-acetylmuramyl pentapeptide phosphotransferase/UDP-N-acetylglucosamine-1-phosphate transferase [Shimia gijangensis]|uniref:UDP-N-acetylmuramyl pentapeptide phosphotransferase/UDP-N-acetylglucosamine-1-phosphate transferase n=1 Tax=Shimia gijangensis TaxID=1470563 RepID=A0A1M6SFQ4_9RHOB|nr:UDP-N-acetylmuramyl pentapeptide phosphotransferase/UDP-N-acetylglucosamine-1-phosphate transferase [Shimia gijangensis]
MLGAFVMSLIVGALFVRFRPALERLTKVRNDHLAVQASHTGNPLRLGGLAAIFGFVFGVTLLLMHSSTTYSLYLLMSLIPAFFAGLYEDLGHGVSAGRRFLASGLSSAAAVMLLGLWVWRGDLPVLDAVMGFIPVGICITIFFGACYSHAVNLIDGMNGLAATVIIFSSFGIASIAAQSNLHEITDLALLLCAATFGFQLLNWPSAKLFLGDAGAYGLGHILAWLGVSIVALASDVAIPAVMLVLFYPIFDTVHTVLRRLRARKNITAPDRMHLHQKIRRGLEIVWIGQNRRHISNPLTTIFLLPMTAAPVAAGVVLWDQPVAAWSFLVVFSAVFGGTHLIVTALARRYRKQAPVCSAN